MSYDTWNVGQIVQTTADCRVLPAPLPQDVYDRCLDLALDAHHALA